MSSANNGRSAWSAFRMNRPKRRMVIAISLAGAICVTLNSFLFYEYVLGGYSVLMQSSSLPPEVLEEMGTELTRIWAILAVLTVLVLSVLTAWVVLLVHRVTGPLVQFTRVFDRLRAGESGARIRLRAKDELQDLATAFNEMIDAVQKSK